MKKKMIVICYKTIKPIVYNEGTPYETSCDEFLSYYTYKTVAEAQKECDELNTTKPECLWNIEKIDWNKIAYFFVSEQEPFDD